MERKKKENHPGQRAGIEDVLEAGEVGHVLRACGFAAFIHQVTQKHYHVRLCVAVHQRKRLSQVPADTTNTQQLATDSFTETLQESNQTGVCEG